MLKSSEAQTLPDDTQASEPQGGDTQAIARGSKLGRYVVLEQLGAGGMGVVYAAYDPQLDRRVALKLLLSFHRSHSARDRLMREAQAMGRLAHPNVVSVHDVGTFGDQVFITMEFVEGATLGEHLSNTEVSVAEILRLYVEAGRGLVAAHHAGLVHRDFKPDNVMVGADGRARVMDFGLARANEDLASAAPADLADLANQPDRPQVDAAPESSSGSVDFLRRPLTRAGRLLGTPAYMSPEQHLGVEAGPASDQFSFCVALFEALYDARPFEGSSLSALALAVTQGRLASISERMDLPAKVHAAILRGLEAEPERRWPSLEALLETLEPEAQQRKQTRLWLALPAIAVAASLGYMSADQGQANADPCAASQQLLHDAWGDGQRASVRANFVATDLPFAAGSFDSLAGSLDDWRTQFRDLHTQACRATHVEGTQSSERLDRSYVCFDRAATDFRALISELEGASEAFVVDSYRVASSLPDLMACRDPRLLDARVEAPTVAQRPQVERVRAQLSQVRAATTAGRYLAASEQGQRLLESAIELAYAPLVAEAQWALGEALAGETKFEVAAEHYEQAFFKARASGHEEVSRYAAVRLAKLVGYRLASLDAGWTWSRHAEAELQRLPDEDLGARLELTRAALLHRQGNGAEALAAARRAQAHWDKQPGPELGQTLQLIGSLQRAGGDEQAALATTTQAFELFAEHLGPQHPHTGSALRARGSAKWAMGDKQGASEDYQAALAIHERSLPPDHLQLATTLSNVGMAAGALGDHDKAAANLKRALEVKGRALGPLHPDLTPALGNLGATYYRMGRFEEALAAHQQALEIRRASLAPDHPDLGLNLINIADVYNELKDPGAAIEALQAAQALQERSGLALVHEQRALVILQLARASALQGREGDARSEAMAAAAHFEQLGKAKFSWGVSLEQLADLLRSTGAEPGQLKRVEAMVVEAKG